MKRLILTTCLTLAAAFAAPAVVLAAPAPQYGHSVRHAPPHRPVHHRPVHHRPVHHRRAHHRPVHHRPPPRHRPIHHR